MLVTKLSAGDALDLADAAQAYVARTLHAQVELRPWPVAAELPPYLRTAYRFAQGELKGRRVLWLLVSEPVTPSALQKHIDTLATRWPDALVTVFRSLPAYVRQRLVQRGIAFVVPGAQLYLPDFGFDMRERTATQPTGREHLRPSAQLLLLHLLYQDAKRALTPSGVAPVLGYTLMTMSRAVAELQAVGLVETARVGRARTFQLPASRRDSWGAAQVLLRTPVLRHVVLPADKRGDAPRPLAGLSALAEYTLLAAPAAPVRAIAAARARELAAARGAPRDAWAMGARDIDEELTEVWAYDPLVLSDGPAVDRLSLYLSLRDDADERVQAALTELLGGVEW
jgi:hypothetical protein